MQPSDGKEEQKGDATREEDPEGLHETLTSSAGYEHMVKNLTRGESRHRASQVLFSFCLKLSVLCVPVF